MDEVDAGVLKNKWKVSKKKLSPNAVNSASKEWTSAIVHKDITFNKFFSTELRVSRI